MRVIAGKFRGRLLTPPEGRGTRPITDRVKETLFNILGHRCGTPGYLPDFEVLDVFAGTGGLGIEALSRGARRCTFVERERRALRVLRDNLTALDLGAAAPVLADNAWTMRPPPVPGGYGLMFVDPPYRDSADLLRAADLLERLAPALAADGVLVFRYEAAGTPFPFDALRSLRRVDERRCGHMCLVLLAPHAPPPPVSQPGDAEL